jgi:hypothetical protein
MSIIPTKTSADPYAAFAWTASVVSIALDKLSLQVTLDAGGQDAVGIDLELDGDEKKAVPELSKQTRLLSKASKISAGDFFDAKANSLPVEVRDSLSTLVAIQRDFYPPAGQPNFEKMSNDLDFIQSHIESGDTKSLHPQIIAEARRACVELLEHLDNHRHSIAPH